jgi:hypothetical protein
VFFKGDGRIFVHRIVDVQRKAEIKPVASVSDIVAARGNACLVSERRSGQNVHEAKNSATIPRREVVIYMLKGDYRPNLDPPVAANQILGKMVAITRGRGSANSIGSSSIRRGFIRVSDLLIKAKDFLS